MPDWLVNMGVTEMVVAEYRARIGSKNSKVSCEYVRILYLAIL